MIKFSPVKFYPWYLVSSDGYVINTRTGAVLRGSEKQGGYVEVCLRDADGGPHYLLMHRVVAEAFCERRAGTEEVNHIDGDKKNNRASNLQWVTHAENLRHAYETGLRATDVTPRPVIAESLETGQKYRYPSIYVAAKAVGVSKGNICLCCKGLRPYAGGYVWRYDE